MATSEQLIPIPGRLHSLAPEGHVAGADEIYDDDLQKSQSEINALVREMGASGENHSAGLVPDPGTTQGNTKYLREDGTWATPAGQDYTEGNGISISSNAISVKAGSNLSFDASGNLNAEDTTYSEATTSESGLMSSSDKTKLDGIQAGAQVHIAPTANEVKTALGTTSGTTKYLREDGTWQEVSASPEVQLGGNTPSSESDIKLFVDESADDTVEVYTKAQADGQFVAVVNMNTEPTESTLTYTSTDGTTKSFKTGDEIRVPDAEADNGYTFYKLYALTTEEGVTTATWYKLGAGGAAPINPNETVNISLTQVGGSSADLIGAAITITDDDSGDTLYTGTWAGTMLTTEIDVNINYTVSVETITGYLACAPQSYQSGYQTERNISFQYRAMGAYVEATDGTLYTSSMWASSGKTANSIVVLTDVCKIRLALIETSLKIHTDDEVPLENYLTIKDETNAKIDYNGAGNTDMIIAFNIAYNTNTTSYAAPYCKAFNFTFPNGEKGCLPSLGQLWTLYKNKATVDACLAACGGTAMDVNYRWSSTFWGNVDTSHRALWILRWSDGNVFRYTIQFAFPVRPVSAYE